MENAAFSLVEHAKTRGEDGAILGDLVLRLLRTQRLEWIEVPVLVLPAPGRERDRAVGATALERLDHRLLVGVRRLGQLGDRRRTSELDGQLLDQLRELDVQLL